MFSLLPAAPPPAPEDCLRRRPKAFAGRVPPCGVCAFLCGVLALPALFAATPHPLGTQRELFVDRALVASMDGVELRMHHPEHQGVAIAFDEPWEGAFSAYATILKDGHRYRMYYRGLPGPEVVDRRAVTCYAESLDGIHWVKPELGLHEVNGSGRTNVILGEVDVHSRNFSPFLDTRPGVPPSERFKAIAGDEANGLLAFVSADGIHWRPFHDDYIFTEGMFDSHNVAFWSASEEQYVCYFRTWTGEGFSGWRTISRTTSPDFLHWSDPVEMSYGDTPPEHLYTNGTHPYFRAPHIYIALAKRFFPEQAGYTGADAAALVVEGATTATSSDAVLMSTRGGPTYDRTFMEAFIRPGPTPRDWVARDNTPALGVVPLNPREMAIYRMSHYGQPTAHLALYTLRTDGFVSAHAGYDGGTLTTTPLTFDGDALEINFATSAAGELRVELLHPDGTPIDGFTRDACQPLRGDEISRLVQWDDAPDLSALSGHPVRLRFHLRDGDLYSYRFLPQRTAH
ncbi:MAG: hypothetical protein ACOC3I_03195 [Verrucomicrobiota bacterium]